ncbi:MAG: preprotein translocase subunit YajC [Candidatus Rokubacteria bacterium]|nr:preprotein translocase subunit YajC [Candidatus Rokubacteria bacterium]
MNVAHAAELAFAQGSGGGGVTSNPIVQQVWSVLPIVAIFAVFYFLLIRPQQKQRRERESMLRAVKKGDRIVTTGGMHGTVMNLTEHTVLLRAADGVKLEFDRSAIGRILEKTAGGDKDA